MSLRRKVLLQLLVLWCLCLCLLLLLLLLLLLSDFTRGVLCSLGSKEDVEALEECYERMNAKTE